MKRVLLILTCLMVTPVLLQAEQKAAEAAKSTTPVEDALVKIEHEWGDALVKRDQATIDSYAASDWMLTTPEGELLAKERADADLKNGVIAFASFRIDELKVRIYGDAAIVSGMDTEKSKYKDKDTSGQYRFTDVFVKRDGHWKCVATHVSRIAPPQP